MPCSPAAVKGTVPGNPDDMRQTILLTLHLVLTACASPEPRAESLWGATPNDGFAGSQITIEVSIPELADTTVTVEITRGATEPGWTDSVEIELDAAGSGCTEYTVPNADVLIELTADGLTSHRIFVSRV
jgi:hypothetical protein